MKNYSVIGKFSKSNYLFIQSAIEEFILNKQEMLIDKSFLFMAAKCDSNNEIEKVFFVGTTNSKDQLLKELESNGENVTHILYDTANSWSDKWGVSEELILMFKPLEIWFLAHDTKLIYSPKSSN